ncbi:MAG: hypothetical protein MK135_14180 [Polyangiaceae bacterium]|nr:hypothetical protein [Polyangiaceae bacterium]
MMALKKIAIFAFAATSALAFVSTASAEEEGYGYEFDDDPLSAGGFGPNDSRIRVRRGAQRSTLIKPRTEFIAELLKSVENL